MQMEDQTSTTSHLTYTGDGTEYAFLMFKNLILTVLTLGIYSAWGRTYNRQYVWGHVSYLGDRAVYTGTGKELFKGWSRLMLTYLLMALGVKLLSMIHPLVSLVTFPLYLYFYALIVYGGSRYRFSRTKWREINFGITKNKEMTRAFIFLVFKTVILSVITLGFYYPYKVHHLRQFLTDRAHFGDRHFSYDGESSELFFLYLKGFLLSVITLGIYLPWFICDSLAYRLEHTKIGEITFGLNLRGKDIFTFAICSYLLSIITLGLATPWLLNWFHKLFINAIQVNGNLDFYSISNTAPETGGATADIASVDYDIDLGF